MPECRYCHQPTKDWHELAVHIIASKKGHRGGKKWAAKYLHRNLLNKRDHPERAPLTDEQREMREDTTRELSGQVEYANTICPKCKRQHREQLPIEFTESPTAWRVKQTLVVLCSGCSK